MNPLFGKAFRDFGLPIAGRDVPTGIWPSIEASEHDDATCVGVAMSQIALETLLRRTRALGRRRALPAGTCRSDGGAGGSCRCRPDGHRDRGCRALVIGNQPMARA